MATRPNDWLTSKKIGNEGTGVYKCSEFVADTCDAAGVGTIVPRNFHVTRRNSYPPVAGDWADPAVNIPGWVVVTTPRPGDIAAQKHDFLEREFVASGHCMIVNTVTPTGGTTIGLNSNHDGRVEVSTWGFRASQAGKVVFKRYMGPISNGGAGGSW
jgi:hypothetical protein